MITEKDLDKLQNVGKEVDGSYCDRRQYSIVQSNRFKGKWDLCHFCEVDGALYYIKTLKDMKDVKKVYEAITDKELELIIKVEVEREDLESLIKGKPPYFDEFDNTLVIKGGHKYNDHSGRTDWSSLNRLTDEELYELYVICKNSWNK